MVKKVSKKPKTTKPSAKPKVINPVGNDPKEPGKKG